MPDSLNTTGLTPAGLDPSTLQDDATLADTIRELANQPAGSGRLARARTRSLAYAERVTTRGPFAPVAELGWGVNRRVQRVGGSALAALIAYRLFVWLLPLALVVVFVLGLFRDEPIDPERAIDRFGVAGYVGASISQATASAGGPSLFTGLVVGGIVLVYETYALVRGLRAVHALVWRTRLTRVPSPLRTTLLALVGLVALVLGRGAIDGLGSSIGGLVELVLTLLGFLIGPVMWLAASLWLPNQARRWTDLVPGAVLAGLATAVIHSLVVLVLFPYLEQKAATYGALGLSAGIMLALYALGWTVTLSAALNAEALEQRLEGSKQERRLDAYGAA